MSTYIAVVKRGYEPVVAEDSEVIPGNIGALKKGLQALLKEDAEDDVRAAQKWTECERLLSEEAETDHGGAQSTIVVNDDFYMESLHQCFGG